MGFVPSAKQQAIFDFIENEDKSLIIEAVAGSGKEQPVFAKVQTPSGEVEIGNLSIGDTIITQSGSHQHVTGVYPQGKKVMYNVIFRDGFSALCGIDHNWCIDNKGKYGDSRTIMTTRELIESGLTKKSGQYKHRIPLCQPVEYSNKSLKVDPYLIGLMIGDGCLSGSTPMLSFNANDTNIIKYVEKLCTSHSIKLNIRNTGENVLQSTLIPINKSYHNEPNWIKNLLCELGLNCKSNEKFIPPEYKLGSISQRIRLLAGLMDSDGCCSNNRTSYSSTSKKLILDVCWLIQSLGGTAIIQKPDARAQTCYQINVKMFENPFLMSHKAEKWSFSNKNPPSRYITGIEEFGQVEQVCISVSSDDCLYLTDHFIVTHNTTTIAAAVKLLPKNIRIMFCAFNKSIATELSERLPDHVNCCTMNSLGHRAWMRHVDSRIELNKNKTYDLMDTPRITGMYDKQELRKVRYIVVKLVGFAKQIGMTPAGMQGVTGLVNDTDANWNAIIDHNSIDMGVSRDGKTRFEVKEETRNRTKMSIDVARAVLKLSIQQKDIIDFSDQLFLPVIYGANFPQNNVIFVDEAQDISAIQRVMLKRSLRSDGRVIAVGDPCQPSGTMVKVVVDKKGKYHGGTIVDKPIEQITEGDYVVSYDQINGQFIRGRRVNGVTRKPYIGKIFKVKTEFGLYTEYTSNHHCIANFAPLRNKYAVYIMTRNNDTQGRIGTCKMDYGKTGSGLVCRFRAENADKCWILGIFDNRNDALFHEQLYSYQHNIPTMRWVDSCKSNSFPQDAIDSYWKHVGDISEQIITCLDSCGKSITYPLFNSSDDYISLKRPMTVRAINLETGCSVLPYKNTRNSRKSDYELIEVEYEHFDGDVYSMDVDVDHTYIGDGIVTHNCQAIYGFRGADSESLNNIKRVFKCESLPLSISYRCAKDVVKEAQQYVEHIEAHEGAPDGKVEHLGVYNPANLDVFQKNDFVLCRNVAPLVKLAFALIAQSKAAGILGKDIGKRITGIINKLKANDIPDLRKKLQKWQQIEISLLQERDPDSTGEYIIQQADTVRAFINCSGATTVKGVSETVEKLFSDTIEGAVRLSTIHKSKGLEAKRVIILDRGLMPSKYAVKPWQKVQENNLVYVAITRSIDYLGYIETPDEK